MLALRWLVADERAREELVEQLLVSDVVGLSPAAARGLLRAARTSTGSIANALDVTEGLTPAEAEAVVAARETLSRAALFAGMSVQDAFRHLWEHLPCSRRLVDRAGESAEARRELDTVVTFANVVAETDEASADAGVEAFLESLDAGEHGPGYSAWERARLDAVQVLTAHGAVGREFDTVLVAGVTEGNFPSLSRPEPMFDLAVLERAVTNAERNRERLDDERRLFDMVLARARRRVVLSCADAHPDERSVRSRFVEPERVAAGARRALRRPGVHARGRGRVALAARRRRPARRGGASPPSTAWWPSASTRAAGGSSATGPTRGVRCTRRSASRTRACRTSRRASSCTCSATSSASAGPAATTPGSARPCTRSSNRSRRARSPRTRARWSRCSSSAGARRSSRRWRSRRPSTELAHDHMLRNWFEHYAEQPAAGIERFFEFEFEGATVIGYIDRIGPAVQDGYVITDFKTGKSDNAGPPRDSLQLGIYYLAVQESPDLAEFQPVKTVELAFLRGNWKSPDIDYRKWMVTERDEQAYQAEMRERLAGLIARKRELNEREVFRPNPYANCRFCDFQTLCPLYAEGQPVFPVEVVRGRGSAGMSAPFPPEVVAAMGGAPPTEEQWRAITMPLEPTVLIAGAGSGKTSVIAARVVYLALAALGRVEGDTPGVLPGNVLALTFTVKATDNLRSRIRRALAGVDLAQGEEPEILNYHALAAQVLERYGHARGHRARRAC